VSEVENGWHLSQERRRAAALQDASRFRAILEWRVLWRFEFEIRAVPIRAYLPSGEDFKTSLEEEGRSPVFQPPPNAMIS
jgi:hypothetical protein